MWATSPVNAPRMAAATVAWTTARAAAAENATSATASDTSPASAPRTRTVATAATESDTSPGTAVRAAAPAAEAAAAAPAVDTASSRASTATRPDTWPGTAKSRATGPATSAARLATSVASARREVLLLERLEIGSIVATARPALHGINTLAIITTHYLHFFFKFAHSFQHVHLQTFSSAIRQSFLILQF